MRLSARLALGVICLTIYISLYPFSDWRDAGTPWWGFLTAPLPRVVTAVDLLGNMLAYIPFGLLGVMALREGLGVWAAALAVLIAGGGLSLTLESVQNFLPSRVPSNLDWASNTFGTAVGVFLGARWGHGFAVGGRFERGWQRLRSEGRAQEIGIAVLVLWWLAQWSPDGVLFRIGALRQMAGIPGPAEFSAERFLIFETVTVVSGALAAGLLAALMLRRHRRSAAFWVLAAGLAVKSAGQALLGSGSNFNLSGALSWLTPGAARGLVLSLVLLLVFATLRPGLQRVVAAFCLLLATALSNLIPDNPYRLPALPGFPAAQWLNLDGLSRLAGVLWPFVALNWLMNLRTKS